MRVSLLRRNSLKARLTLAVLGVLIIVLWGFAWFANRELRQDMLEQVKHQQQSTLSLLVHSVNENTTVRLRALEALAQSIDPLMLAAPGELQRLLQKRPVLQQMFSAGIVVLDQQGLELTGATLPTLPMGGTWRDQPPVQIAMLQGRPVIGQADFDPVSKTSTVSMAVPMVERQQVLGVVVGLVDLGQHGFLDIISQGKYGQSGGYLLIDAVQRRVIAASDPKRVHEQLPEPGVNPIIDRFLEGYSGTQVMRNPHGDEVLASDQTLDTVPWVVAVVLPTEEAFAPIHAVQQRLLIFALVASLLAGLLVWWLLRGALTPVLDTINHITRMSESAQPPEHLPVARNDELGLLVRAFNSLLERQASVQRELLRHTDMLGRNEEVANIGSWRWQVASDKVSWSDQLFRIFKLDPARGAPSFAEHERFYLPSDLQRLREAVARALADHTPYELELRALCADGSQRVCIARGRVTLGPDQSVIELYGTVQDITELKQAQAAVAANEARLQAMFDTAHEGITITDAKANILDINASFTRITGYRRDEVIGQNPRVLQSGRQDGAFYQAMWAALTNDGHWCGEIWNRRKSGELFPEWLDISAVKDSTGTTQQYVAMFSDITVRKALETQVQQLAFFDPLTALPNRRLLTDRLSQVLLAAKRSGHFGAVMFLDLDNFKPLNDAHGHAMGDLLLTEVARRLQASVRQNDTVARMGGDEFVVMLTELDGAASDAQAQTLVIAEKIRQAIAQRYALVSTGSDATQPIEHHCTCSIGIVLVAPGRTDQETILQQADAAMYQAKAAGRNQVVLTHPGTAG